MTNICKTLVIPNFYGLLRGNDQHDMELVMFVPCPFCKDEIRVRHLRVKHNKHSFNWIFVSGKTVGIDEARSIWRQFSIEGRVKIDMMKFKAFPNLGYNDLYATYYYGEASIFEKFNLGYKPEKEWQITYS